MSKLKIYGAKICEEDFDVLVVGEIKKLTVKFLKAFIKNSYIVNEEWVNACIEGCKICLRYENYFPELSEEF